MAVHEKSKQTITFDVSAFSTENNPVLRVTKVGVSSWLLLLRIVSQIKNYYLPWMFARCSINSNISNFPLKYTPGGYIHLFYMHSVIYYTVTGILNYFPWESSQQIGQDYPGHCISRLTPPRLRQGPASAFPSHTVPPLLPIFFRAHHQYRWGLGSSDLCFELYWYNINIFRGVIEKYTMKPEKWRVASWTHFSFPKRLNPR